MITIFTDGSSRGNPGPGGWGAVVASSEKVRELGGRINPTTNNRMELTAAIESLKIIDSARRITLFTDSSYMINGITKWVFGWQKNNWITATKQKVLNDDLWKDLVAVTIGKQIEWKYVAGHSGIPANERCDEIATAFADEASLELFNGPKSEYPIDLTNLVGNLMGEKKPSKSAKAYSYLSLVDGEVQIHKTWAECERRVKGVKKVKFKKSLSKEDETAIIQSWKIK